MSLRDFTVLKRALLTACIAITLTGCAASRMKISLIDEKPAERVNGHQVSDCNFTQRDLTIPWSLRQYWCGQAKRKVDLQAINDQVMDQVASEQNHLEQTYLEEINDELNNGEYDPADAGAGPSTSPQERSLDRDDALKLLKRNDNSHRLKVAPAHPLNSEAAGLNSPKKAIIFAQNLRILGPQGRAATQGLIEQVSISDRVLIRGLILPEEVLVDSRLYREKLSVGRALAVRQYWQEQGLNTSHITILHDDPELSGRIVEVVFHG